MLFTSVTLFWGSSDNSSEHTNSLLTGPSGPLAPVTPLGDQWTNTMASKPLRMGHPIAPDRTVDGQ
jgi:hypothetical protein